MRQVEPRDWRKVPPLAGDRFEQFYACAEDGVYLLIGSRVWRYNLPEGAWPEWTDSDVAPSRARLREIQRKGARVVLEAERFVEVRP